MIRVASEPLHCPVRILRVDMFLSESPPGLPVPGGPGESLLVQGQLDEGDGGELLTELLEDDESSQQGQVLQSEDTQMNA